MENEETEFDTMTVTEVEQLCKNLFELRKKVDDMEEAVSEEKKKLESLKARALSYLGHFNKTNYRSEFGMLIRAETLNVKVEDRKAFSEYLKAQDAYDNFVTFNSQKVKSLGKEEWELAKQESRDFKIPGLSTPQIIETLRMTKG